MYCTGASIKIEEQHPMIPDRVATIGAVQSEDCSAAAVGCAAAIQIYLRIKEGAKEMHEQENLATPMRFLVHEGQVQSIHHLTLTC